jgi:hypothetical protein
MVRPGGMSIEHGVRFGSLASIFACPLDVGLRADARTPMVNNPLIVLLNLNPRANRIFQSFG